MWGKAGGGGGGGGKFGTYSILHTFLSCNCAKIFNCISLQHSCELSLRMVFVSVDGLIYRQTEKHADRQVSPDYSTGSIKVPYGQRFT